MAPGKFNREKLETGINVAENRPISAEAIEEMIREVVDELYDEFDGEVLQGHRPEGDGET